MKIKAIVVEVKDNGEILAVLAQGQGVAEAGWMAQRGFNLPMQNSERNRRAFYIGRNITITVKTERP